MEMSSSYAEEPSVKMRKPYTITKLREKWTEEEHSRFLEALKLYGRAWQRIEEHIGTKTTIQIRSHAQKFFTKLEKEAVTTGTPLGQAHDIDIPPPRPKKKPTLPYPRKTGFCAIPPSAEAAKTMDSGLGKNSTQEPSDASDNQHSDGVQCSSVAINFFKDIPTPSTSSRDNNGFRKGSSFREFVPMAAKPEEPHSPKGSSLTADVIMEPSSAKQEEKVPPDVEAQHHEAPSSPPFHAASSSVSYISHPFPAYPPFSQFIENGEDFYGSFLGISSAFSNLVASSLLQNPAVHAAACMAAAVWPSDEMIHSNLATIASATVAAASAWWAHNGLIPFFLPAQHGFEFAPPPTSAAGSEPMCQTEERLNLSSKLPFSPLSDEEEQVEAGASILMAGGTSGKQLQECSSCGSNTTTSGSETETDAAPANDGHELLQPPGEACNTRRPRNCFCFNETWKEVSQEGRIAFQALFARDVLPQTFRHSKFEEMGQAKKEDSAGFKPYKRDSAGSGIDQTCSSSSSSGGKRVKLLQPSCSSC